MTGPDFTAEECQVLGILMQPDRPLEKRTVDIMAAELGMEAKTFAFVLDELKSRGVVPSSTDATLEAEVWIATNKAGQGFDSPPE